MSTMLHQLMVGRTLQADYYYEPLQKPFREEVALEAEGLTLDKAYRDVSFRLHAGEILGIAGVVGSGPRGVDPHALRLRASYFRNT